MAEVTTNSNNVVSPLKHPSNLRMWLILVVVFIAGGLLGYLYAAQKAQDTEQRLQEQVDNLEKVATGRTYVNGNLKFAMPIPSEWVNKYAANESDTSVKFSFSGSATKPSVDVFTIYRCQPADYLKDKGKTDDTTKCPGMLITGNSDSFYSYKPFQEKSVLAGAPESTDEVIKDLKEQVLPHFQILK